MARSLNQLSRAALALICPPRIYAALFPPEPTREELAERMAAKFPDQVLTAQDVLDIWDRHPLWAPGGPYFDKSDLNPKRARA